MIRRDEVTPRELAAIFKAFLVIGCTAFGGGASAHIHDVVVQRKKWLDDRRMLEGMTIARIVPGTNVSNLAAFVGSLLAGYRGALVAVVGVVAPGLAMILALAVVYAKLADHAHAARPALHGLTAGAVGIMASLVAKNAKTVLRAQPSSIVVAVLAFAAAGVLEINMLVTLTVLVPISAFLARAERGS